MREVFSPNFDLILDLADRQATGRLELAGSRVVASTKKPGRLIRNDAGVARIRACLPSNTGERLFDDVDLSAATVAIALGSVDKVPSSGTFPLAPIAAQTSGLLSVGKRYLIVAFVAGDSFLNVGAAANTTGTIFTATGTTPTTWTNTSAVQEITTDLDVDATAAEVQTALNATAAITALGGVTVTMARAGAYQVIFSGAFGAQVDISGPVTSNLYPISTINVFTSQTGTSALHEVQIIRVIENPYCYAVLSTAFPVAAASVTTIQTQTASLSAIKKLTLDPMPYGGTVLITLDGVSFEASYDSTTSEMQVLAGSNYTVVRRANNAWEFTRNTVNTAMTLSAVVTNLLVPVGVTGLMPLNTLGMFQAFNATEADTLQLLLEVNITFPGFAAQKVYQEMIEVHRDLIDLALLTTASLGTDVAGSGQSADITVRAAGTHDLVPDKPFLQWFQLVEVENGEDGPYTHTLTIDNVEAVVGAIYRIELDIEAGTNPTIEIYDNTTAGTLLQTISGQGDAATYFIFEARYDGTNWHKFDGRYVT